MTASSIALDGMTSEDIPRLLEIEHVCFPVPWSGAMFVSQLGLGDIAINLVLREEGSIIGYAVAWAAAGEIHLLSIAILPEKRGRGLADKLLDEVVERGKEKGGERVILEVRIGNAAARRFYEKRGFRHVGERKGYYRDSGEDAIVMELRL
jgi:ribosomal-protein-alanine N-acetyltransferase